jgi:adenylate cyclase
VDKRRRHLRTKLFLGVAFGATALVLIAFFFQFGFFEGLQRQWVDTNFDIRGKQAAPKDVVLVAIDPVSFDELQLRWPFPRSLHAKLLDTIRSGDPKAVAFDVQFTEPTAGPGGPAQDEALFNAVARLKDRIVLSTTEVFSDAKDHVYTRVLGGDDNLRSIGAVAANGNYDVDSDGAVRKVPYEVDGLENLSLVAAGLARGRPFTKSDLGGSEQWIDFAGPSGTVRTYSYARVVPVKIVRRGKGLTPWKLVSGDGLGRVVGQAATKDAAERRAGAFNVQPSVFRNKVVVIGSTASSLQDIHATSVDPAMPGPEIHAEAIQTALDNFPLRSVGTFWNVVLIICLGVVVPLASLRMRPFVAVATGIFFAAFLTGGAILAFRGGTVVSFVYPLAALTLSTVGAIAIHYIVTAFEKERVRDVFSRFVPDTVVDQVLAQSGEDLRIGGREVVGTVLFSDLRGFTSSAEFMPADKVIHVLNHYLHEMSEAILRHGGTLLCYMGDGIYALFGAPLDQDDHADRALAASREMLTQRLPAFNQFMQEMDLGTGYFMGVGLNSGPVMTGNVGHERRMDYTAVGDVVNTASRIEGMTKETPYSVLIAESTVESLRHPPADIVFYEEQSVRGRKEKLKLYALDIKKTETAPGTDVEAAKPADWKTDEPAPDAPPTPALG